MQSQIINIYHAAIIYFAPIFRSVYIYYLAAEQDNLQVKHICLVVLKMHGKPACWAVFILLP